MSTYEDEGHYIIMMEFCHALTRIILLKFFVTLD